MKSKHIILSVFIIAVFSASTVLGASVLTLTLNESIDIALKQSVNIRSAKEEVIAAHYGEKQAFTSFLPKVDTSYSYTRLNEVPHNASSVQTGTQNNYIWSLEANQPLFAGGKILSAYRISKIETEILRAEEKITVQDVVLDVKHAYYNILKAERMRAVAEQSVEQLKAHRDLAQNYYDVGIIPKNDLLFAEVELANGNQNLVVAENNVELAKAKFNAVLRKPIGAPVNVEDILSYKPFEKDFESCLDAAFNNRQEIKAYRLRVEKQDKNIDLAQSDFFPSVNLIGSYSRYGDTPEVAGSDFTDQEEWYVMALASWNIWEWGRTKYNVEATRSGKNKAENNLIDIKDQISLEVKDAYLNLKAAEKRIFVAQKAIEQAEENFRINKERYKEQVATSTDVIDAQTLLTKTKSDYYNALSDYNISRAFLERTMGIVYTGSS